MKWAPNKKLHFEVAVIKAIQTLSQVTLNEVIEDLSAIRDGKAPASPPLAKGQPRKAERPTSNVQRPTSNSEGEPAAAAARVLESAPDSLDLDALWQKAVEQIRARRPLIKGWIESAKVLGQEGRFLLLGFPPEEKAAMESIAMPRNRDFLQALLKEISGRDWEIKFNLQEGLTVEAPPAEEEAPRKAQETATSFIDDPLIRAALKIFKGEIKPVTE